MQKPHRLGRHSCAGTGFDSVEGMAKNCPRQTFSGRRSATLQSDRISQITADTPGDGVRRGGALPLGGFVPDHSTAVFAMFWSVGKRPTKTPPSAFSSPFASGWLATMLRLWGSTNMIGPQCEMSHGWP